MRKTLAELAAQPAAASVPPAPVPSAPTPIVLTPPALEPEPEPEREDAFQSEIRRQFVQSSPQLLVEVRQRLQAVVKSEADVAYLRWLEERAHLLQEMYRTLHSLTGKAGLAGFKQVAQLSSALEAFLRELHQAPQNANSSSLRTFAHAMA